MCTICTPLYRVCTALYCTFADLKSSGRRMPSFSSWLSTAVALLCSPLPTPIAASATRAPAACTRSSVGRVTASASTAFTPTRMAGPEACLHEEGGRE